MSSTVHAINPRLLHTRQLLLQAFIGLVQHKLHIHTISIDDRILTYFLCAKSQGKKSLT
jgi:hypothetical protein